MRHQLIKRRSSISVPIRTAEVAPRQHQMTLPMSIRCKACSFCVPKGSVFSCREEVLHDLKFYRCRITRLFFNCPSCNHELTMKNSSRNNAYVVDAGATRSDDADAALEELRGLVLGRADGDVAGSSK